MADQRELALFIKILFAC